jgi:hypothetical protein
MNEEESATQHPNPSQLKPQRISTGKAFDLNLDEV